MSRVIKTWRDPYDEGFSTCRPKEITLYSGLTVFVGCNGSGKSTLLHNIEDSLRSENIPYVYYDNKVDGGNRSIGRFLGSGNLSMGSTMLCSSEGEQIRLNIGTILSEMRNFINTGETRKSINRKKKYGISVNEDVFETLTFDKERWVLLDAVDSGYSIDNVLDLKEIFKYMIDDATEFNKDLYIIITANEYELANGEKCFDVNSGKYISFKDYEDYKKFIIKSRKNVDKRYERVNAKKEKEKRKDGRHTNDV